MSSHGEASDEGGEELESGVIGRISSVHRRLNQEHDGEHHHRSATTEQQSPGREGYRAKPLAHRAVEIRYQHVGEAVGGDGQCDQGVNQAGAMRTKERRYPHEFNLACLASIARPPAG